MNTILNFLFLILSYSPILCISDDATFGTNVNGLHELKKRLRLSIFSFYFGAYKYYFITFKINNNRLDFKIKYKISLFDFNNFTDEDVKRVTNIQKEYLESNGHSDEDKEFLLYKIESENNRKSIAYNKVNTYTTIILALIPLILIFYKVEMFVKSHIVIKILILVLFYIIANICILLLQVNKVKEYSRQRYADLKKVDKKKGIIMAYYLDYQCIKREVDRLVGFVKNIEIYIIGAVVCTSLLTIGNYISISNNRYKQVAVSKNIYQIDINKLESKDNESMKVINTINEKVPDDDVIKVLVLYNNDEILKNESFNAIVNYFNIFKSKNDVVLLKDNDEGDKSKIKIIMVED